MEEIVGTLEGCSNIVSGSAVIQVVVSGNGGNDRRESKTVLVTPKENCCKLVAEKIEVEVLVVMWASTATIEIAIDREDMSI